MTLRIFDKAPQSARPRAKPRLFGAVTLLASVAVALAASFSATNPVVAQSAGSHPGKPIIPAIPFWDPPPSPEYSAPTCDPWTDTPVQVVQIKFDHQGPDPYDGLDAIDCCYTLGDGPNSDLHHKGEGKGDGEYDTVNGYNEPAVWVHETPSVRIRVRFKVNLDLAPNRTPFLARAKIKAVVTDGDWIDVAETTVNFDPDTQYSILGVSEYVPMYLGGEGEPMPSGLKWEKVTWQWSMRDLEFINGGGDNAVIQLGTTTHHFFTIFERPKAPWYATGTKNHIPVNLLAGLYGTPAEVGFFAYEMRGLTTPKQAFTQLITKMFSEKDFAIVGGLYFTPRYANNRNPNEVTEFDPESIINYPRQAFYRWMKYFAKSEAFADRFIHYSEPAFALRIIGALLGIESNLVISPLFGFQRAQPMIGGQLYGDINNPIWRDSYHPDVAHRNLDLSTFLTRRNTLLRYFNVWRNYTWCEMDNEPYDGYVGPHIGVASRTAYMADFRWTDSLLPTGDFRPLYYQAPNNFYYPIPKGNEVLIPTVYEAWNAANQVNVLEMTDTRLGEATPDTALRLK